MAVTDDLLDGSRGVAEPAGDLVLECRAICKRFPGLLALDHVDLEVRRGEVHALLGQNGAGKSTLVKILTGVYTCDEGSIRVDGQEVRVSNPADAEARGIAIVHQDPHLVPLFDVTRNAFLGREITGPGGWMDLSAMRRATAETLQRVGADFGPDTLIRDLSIAQREQVAIATALIHNPKVLILDEPTASLSNSEIERLFGIIRSLQAQAVTIIYISHHLDEIFQIANRITVLRDGKKTGTLAVENCSRSEIIRLMVGRDLRQLYPKEELAIGETILEIRNLTQGRAVHGVTLTVRRGEILGIAGLVGAGRTETALTLFGALSRSGGEVVLAGKRVHPRTPRAAKELGFALIPEDRRNEGLITGLSVGDNLTLANLRKWATLGFIRKRKERAEAGSLIETLKIATTGLAQQTFSLSGGNQQKVVIGRWLTGNAQVFIFDEPTTGVDVGSKVEIYKQMTEVARKGAAVIFISSDFEELHGMCDRVAVMARGRVVKELTRGEATLQDMLYWATGGAEVSEREAAPAEARAHISPLRRWSRWLSRWGTLAGMVAALLVLGFSAPGFFAPTNLLDVLKQGSILTLIAFGLTTVLIAGGFDMSAGAVSQCTSNLAAGLIIRGLGTAAALAVGSAAGLVIGLFNAILVVGLRMPPFVATLGTMFVLMGGTLAFNKGQALTIHDRPGFVFLGQGYLGPIPFVLVVVGIVLLVLHFFLKRTRPGQHMYAVGGSLQAARLRGLSQTRALVLAFALGGLVTGFSGVVQAAYSYGASALATGTDFLISALAASFLGSTLSRTGELDVMGTTVAAMFIASVGNGLILSGVSNLALPGIQGAILILSILFGVLHKREIGQVTIL